MDNKLLVVIDVQNDFINKNTKKILEKIEELINSKQYENVVFTKFINNKDSRFYNDLQYKGCLTEKGIELAIKHNELIVFEKTTYTALTEQLKIYINKNEINNIYLCGFDTEACVLKTALDMFEKEYNVFILKDYCMSGAGQEMHNNAIEIIKRTIGKKRII